MSMRSFFSLQMILGENKKLGPLEGKPGILYFSQSLNSKCRIISKLHLCELQLEQRARGEEKKRAREEKEENGAFCANPNILPHFLIEQSQRAIQVP